MKEATYPGAPALAATSYYVDKAAAEQAVALAPPMLESAMRHAEVAESGVIMVTITPDAARFDDRRAARVDP